MTNLKIGVVGLPGKWSTEVLADAVEAVTGNRLIVDMAQVTLDLQQGSLWFQGHDLCQFDVLLVKKIHADYSHHTLDRLEMLRYAEAQGVLVMSPATNILRLIDRLSCTVTLRQHDIPMPPTTITEDIEKALEAVYGYQEVVLKPLYSTKARGMEVINSQQTESEIRQRLRQFSKQHPVMYIQKKLALPGKDLGMVFLGGKYIGSYARVSQNDSWNTTILSGGKYQAFDAPNELIDLAFKAQQPFAMDFTTVDVAESETGPIVFEVSAFGGFRGCQEGLNLNVAEQYVDYAIKKHARLFGEHK
ncbi:MAG: GAK system ATP-grasp enzyme [Aestuariibacter sp.]